MNLLQWFYKPKPGQHKMRYILTGKSDDYNITYKCSESCQVIQNPHVRKGWKHTFTGNQGDYFFIAAQSNRPHSTVSLKVYEDGKLFMEVEKSGDYPMVEAFGNL